MKFSGRSLSALALMALISVFIGCGGSGGSGSSGGSSTGTVSMSITDAKPILPDNVTNCFVMIDAVSVHSSGGGWEPLPMVQTPFRIDLLQFTDGITTEFVPPVALASGKYTQVRLSVVSAKLRFNEDPDNEVEITIPSENLKTDKNFDFDVSQGAAVDITIDFDLSKSIVVEGPAGNPSYKLKPVLHIVETSGAATIAGTIDNSLFLESYAVITVFDSTGQEYTKVRVDMDEEATDEKTAYPSIFWLVPNQAYTVALNEDPVADDDPNTEDIIEETQEITVDVPSDSAEDQSKYPKGTLPPGAIYGLNFVGAN